MSRGVQNDVNFVPMGRLHNGMIVRTSYNTGPYEVTSFTDGCTCPSFHDAITLCAEAPLSKPHCHIRCKKVGERGDYYLNGYDENFNSVWGNDRLINCAEETLFLTMCCG